MNNMAGYAALFTFLITFKNWTEGSSKDNVLNGNELIRIEKV